MKLKTHIHCFFSILICLALCACDFGVVVKKIHKETSESELPFSFKLGNDKITGIPDGWARSKSVVFSNGKRITTYTGKDEIENIEIVCEKTEYKNYPVAEWLVWLKNTGKTDSKNISEFNAAEIALEAKGGNLSVWNGIGEWTKNPQENYSFKRTPLKENEKFVFAKSPDGYPCHRTFPYFRVVGENGGYSVAVGWPGDWSADLENSDGKIKLRVSQRNLNGALRAGEKIRSPRITILSFDNETDGVNIWRKWIRNVIMPREKDGKTLRPRIGIVARESSPEWVNEDENGQLRSLELMKSKGIKADTWWIDAGWFLKRNTPSWWFVSQWWHADKEKYPHSMRHFSEILNKENIELLLWHEPERMCISEKYPLPDGLKKEWIIPTEKASADKSVEAAYFDMTNDRACDWLCKLVDSSIKENGVSIYREDSNGSMKRVWDVLDKKDGRRGFAENFYIQNRIKFWTYLRKQNKGLIIDSCAAGGRRNDLESLRIGAVPLHYSDVIVAPSWLKQRYHNMLCEWFVYFKEENIKPNMNKRGKFCDALASVGLAAPYCTIWINDLKNIDIEKDFRHYRTMRAVAKYMVDGDFFKLADENVSNEKWNAVQFSANDIKSGVIFVSRNENAEDDKFIVRTKEIDIDSMYNVLNHADGKKEKMKGDKLAALEVRLPKGDAAILEYTKE